MDFLALEQPFMQRLADNVRIEGKDVDVVSVREVKTDDNKEPVLRVPAILVSYDGYTVPESSLGKARVRQTWSATAVISNLRDRGRIGAREDSAVLVDQILTFLLGWIPPVLEGRAYRALELTNPTYPVEYGKRNAYFPISFTTERSFKGVRT